MSGTLFIVGTPIGNREDITLRALRVLAEADIILCEDTRETGKLLGMYDEYTNIRMDELTNERIRPKLVRCDDHAERRMVGQVVIWLQEGKQVALVSDAGMPLISDPGFVLVRECQKMGLPVTVVPGPSAVTAAAAIAGVPVNQFLFVGFLPEKKGKRQKILNAVCSMQYAAELKPTVIIYESPYHLRRTLGEIAEIFGEAEVAAVGEVTKLHEKVLRGTAEAVLGQLPETVKGEWVILVARSI